MSTEHLNLNLEMHLKYCQSFQKKLSYNFQQFDIHDPCMSMQDIHAGAFASKDPINFDSWNLKHSELKGLNRKERKKEMSKY